MSLGSHGFRVAFTAACLVTASCGSQKFETLGGEWELGTTHVSFSVEGSYDTTHLYRRHGSNRVEVAPLVCCYRYYSDDCLVFHTNRKFGGYFMGCGDRILLPLSEPEDGIGAEWVLGTSALEVRQRYPDRLLRSLDVAQVKRQALSQPYRSTEPEGAP